MKKVIRILLCDDSSVMRRLVKVALESDSNLQVVGEAKHGKDALNQIPSVKPDIVIMDVEMPVMDGIDAVREIRKVSKTLPVIMFSSLTSRGAEATLDAITAGANDFATKPSGAGHFNDALAHVRGELNSKVRLWAQKTAISSQPASAPKSVAESRVARATSTPASPVSLDSNAASSKVSVSGSGIGIIAIGVSTGGPQALASLIKVLPLDFSVPVLIAQHMPPVFTGLLAERLAAQKGHQVREACHGDEMKAGEILIAPGDHHLFIRREKNSVRTCLNQDAPENSCRPSVDPLFRSIAATYGNKSLGIVLTGMGSDGTEGCRALKKTGAKILVQDEESSVVWGMPGNVVQHGLADRVLPPDQIAMEMLRVANHASKNSLVGNVS